jgi:hypothetical protein
MVGLANPTAAFPRRNARFIDQSDDRAEDRRGGARAVNESQGAVDGDDVVCAVGGEVGARPHGLGIIILRRRIARLGLAVE